MQTEGVDLRELDLCWLVGWPSLSHLTSYTHTKHNVYLANSLATDISDPDL
jgi:hypothetical protein